jgi:hypothetical protein
VLLEVELEEEAVDLIGSEFSYEDILECTNHMINFSNSKDDRFLTFLQPMKAMAVIPRHQKRFYF